MVWPELLSSNGRCSIFVLSLGERIRNNVAASRALAALREALLPKLISGQVGVGRLDARGKSGKESMKSISKQLLDRAVLAMVAAIEVYNKPGFPYRNESFTILAINGWELLLKAKWLDLHSNKKQSLYIYENRSTRSGGRSAKKYIKKTRSRAPFTHGLGYLARQLVNKNILDPAVSQNIEIMLEFRDCATHFYNESRELDTRLYEIGAACVKNFVNVVDRKSVV